MRNAPGKPTHRLHLHRLLELPLQLLLLGFATLAVGDVKGKVHIKIFRHGDPVGIPPGSGGFDYQVLLLAGFPHGR